MSRFLFTAALFLFNCFGAFALDVPKLERRVTDLAGVLTPGQVTSLESRLQKLEETDSTQIAVLIIPSLEGEYLEGYSIRVAEAWKLGQKGRDNGAILLVSIADRAIRIEVGYGLEATLTDLKSGRIIRNEMIPRFRQRDYYAGIDAGVTGIIETVRGTYQGTPSEERRQGRPRGNLFNLLIVLLFPLLWILSATGKWGGGIIGAGAGILLPLTMIGRSLGVMLAGGVIGGLLGMLLGALVRAGAKSGGGTGGGPFFLGGGGFPGGRGGFGGGGFGGGGFSGGGGGFGGGGSSGRW